MSYRKFGEEGQISQAFCQACTNVKKWLNILFFQEVCIFRGERHAREQPPAICFDTLNLHDSCPADRDRQDRGSFSFLLCSFSPFDLIEAHIAGQSAKKYAGVLCPA